MLYKNLNFTLPSFSATSLILVLFSNQSYSSNTDETEQRFLHMDQEVITGTRTAKQFIDSPVRVEVVTRDEIRDKHARDVKEALEDVPGLMLRPLHGKPGYEVWMQGVDGKRVLVLIDGEPVSQSTNRKTDVSQIGTANIEQIEIVKGATSALYGSGAIGGVINIITRKSTSPLSYTLQGNIGSYGDQNINDDSISLATRNASGLLSLMNERWDTQISFDLRESDGFNIAPRNLTKDPSDWKREGSYGSRINTSAELGYSPNTLDRYFISAAYYEEDINDRYFPLGHTPPPYLKTEIAKRKSFKAGADWLLEDGWGDLNIRYSYENLENPTSQDIRTTSSPDLDQYRSADDNKQKFSSQWNYDVNDSILRTIGVEYESEEIEQSQWKLNSNGIREFSSELTDNAESSRKTIYYQDDIFIGDNFEVLPGFRFQNDSDFGSYFSPKVNGRYNLPDNEYGNSFLRFGVGRGYKVPSLKERYYIFDHRRFGYLIEGDSSLTPENSDSFQLGWVMTKDDRYFVDINLFRNDIEDLIETQTSHYEQDGTQVFRYGNISRARTQGIEISSKLGLTESLQVSAAYTYLDAKDLDTDLDLPKRPDHQVKTTFSYKPKGSQLSVIFNANWEHKSYFDTDNTQESPAHSVFDIKANYQIISQLSLYAGIDNFTGTQKDFGSSHDLRPDASRYYYIGLRLEQD